MKKRTKIIILSVMILLLGVTGYLNIVLNRQESEQPIVSTTTSSYFAAYRTTRESDRDQKMLTYDAIIASDSYSQEAKVNAENDKRALMNLISQELTVEGLIKAKGFDDCIVTIGDPRVNVIVKCDELDAPQVARIVDVLQGQLKVAIKNIKIMSVE